MRATLIALLMSGWAFAAAADTLDDAETAYNRGDYETAIRLWRPLADQGNAGAQFNLGYMYANGKGVTDYDAEAVKLYRKAADQGDAAAQYNLGYMYANGQGVPQNDVQAYMWFNLAAAQGNANAEEAKEIVAKRMTREQIAEAQKLSAAWKPVRSK